MSGKGDRAAPSSIIVAAQTGEAVRVGAGEFVEVTDVEGVQVGDFFAVRTQQLNDWMSMSQTRNLNERLIPRPGDHLVSGSGVPMLAFVEDRSPGLHDALFPCCDAAYYEAEGLPGHPNCRDNFLSAAAAAGVPTRWVSDPFNLFQSSLPDPDRDWTIRFAQAASRPGDSVVFQALEDLLVILTSCSVDNDVTNGYQCTPLRLDIHD